MRMLFADIGIAVVTSCMGKIITILAFSHVIVSRGHMVQELIEVLIIS